MGSVTAMTIDRSMKGRVSDAEWDTRVNLAACYRLLAHHGMTDGTATHISARVPDEPDTFLLNPYGYLFDEITASSLVKINHQGEIVDGSTFPYNEAGFCIHSAVLKGRPEIGTALHTHSDAGMAVAAQKCGLLPISQTALRFYDNIAYHDYEGIALDLSEQERLQKDLGGAYAMILKHHGLLTVGRTVAEAWTMIWDLEKACQSQVWAMAGGMDNIDMPSEEVCRHTAEQYARHYSNKPAGEAGWPAQLRMLDRIDPSYRD